MMDEEGMQAIDGLFKGLQFLEVQGLGLNQENKVNILVTPVIPPVTPAFATQMPIPPAPEQPAEEAPNA